MATVNFLWSVSKNIATHYNIYCLNERLLSTRSHCDTFEERESECPNGEVFEE